MKLLHVVMGTAVLWGLVGQAFVVRAEPAEIEFHAHEEAEQNRLFDKPTLNPSPQRAVVIEGRKDSNLELWFALTYTTQEKQCQTQTLAGRVMGAPDTSQEVIDWLRVAAGQTEYSVRFFSGSLFARALQLAIIGTSPHCLRCGSRCETGWSKCSRRFQAGRKAEHKIHLGMSSQANPRFSWQGSVAYMLEGRTIFTGNDDHFG